VLSVDEKSQVRALDRTVRPVHEAPPPKTSSKKCTGHAVGLVDADPVDHLSAAPIQIFHDPNTWRDAVA
jgi:hypothetical protein